MVSKSHSDQRNAFRKWGGPRYNNTVITISVEDMQRDLTGYLDQVQSGETLLVMQEDKPVAEIKPVAEPSNRNGKQQPRPFGLCVGAFVVPDDFDAPLPEDVLSLFEGK